MRRKQPLIEKHYGAQKEFHRIRADTIVGMAFSNLIALSIIVTAAATLHAAGKTDIQTSAQAAEALRPIAGAFAEVIFALGIVGTGLLAIPVLAGATAYAVGEGRRWPVGLARKPKEAAAFYAVLALSAAIGIALNFTSINPISALYWSAVINGVLAVPVMVLLMFMARRRDVMGRFVVGGPLYWLGWLSTAAMLLSVRGDGRGVFRRKSSGCNARIIAVPTILRARARMVDASTLPDRRMPRDSILPEHDRRHPAGHQRHEGGRPARRRSRSAARWWRRTARSRP